MASPDRAWSVADLAVLPRGAGQPASRLAFHRWCPSRCSIHDRVPTTSKSLFESGGLVADGVVRWRDPIPAPKPGSPTTGVYLVALTADAADLAASCPECPLSTDRIDELLEARPELRLDGSRCNSAALAARLSSFWLADEVVVYIGLAGPRKKTPKEGELAKRVGEYYKTPLGARSPHAGGWFIKTLAVLDQLYVHYAYCDEVDRVEQRMLFDFIQNVSRDCRARLHDPERAMPFANLEYPPGVRKCHGISGVKAPRRTG